MPDNDDLCPTCGTVFFTIHGKSDCIAALKVRVAALEKELQNLRARGVMADEPRPDYVVELAPDYTRGAEVKLVQESLELAAQRGGFD